MSLSPFFYIDDDIFLKTIDDDIQWPFKANTEPKLGNDSRYDLDQALALSHIHLFTTLCGFGTDPKSSGFFIVVNCNLIKLKQTKNKGQGLTQEYSYNTAIYNNSLSTKPQNSLGNFFYY